MKRISGKTWYYIIFGLSMCAITLQNCMLTSSLNDFITGIRLFVLLMECIYLIYFISNGISINSLIKVILLLALTTYTGILMKTFELVMILPLLLCSINITDKEFLNLFFKWQIFEIIFMLISWPISVVLGKGSWIYGSESFEIAQNRIAWGTIHPNNAAILFLWCLITYLVLNFKHSKNYNIKLIICFIFAIFCQVTTKSDIFWYFYIFEIGIFLLRKDLAKNIIISIGKNIFWILGIIDYLLILSYSGWGPLFLENLSKTVNNLTSERIAMSNLAFLTNGITLFGQDIKFNNPLYSWTTNYRFDSFTIDMFYAFLALQCGLIYFILISIGFNKLCKKKGALFSLVVIIFSLTALSNVNIVFPTITFVIFYMRDLIFNINYTSKLNDFWNS